MKKTRPCPLCKSIATARLESYHSGKFHKDGVTEIIVNDIAIYECSNAECKHTWLPSDQEMKIDKALVEGK